MKPLIAVCIAILVCSQAAWGQYDMLAVEVSFDYEKVRIKEALADLSETYGVKFSYSSKKVNVRQRVSAKVEKVPMSAGLTELFKTTQIEYSRIGQHIVLKKNPDKLLSQAKKQRKKKNAPPVIERTEAEPPAVLVSAAPEKEKKRPLPDSVLTLEMPNARPLRREGKMHPFDETLLNFEKWRTHAEYAMRPTDDKRLAQISLLPKKGTNSAVAPDVTNNVSLNLLWGNNGGVDGMEIGTFVNTINKDVVGLQVAGIGNKVGRNVTGTQVGFIFNANQGMTRGLQVAGIVNVSKDVQAAQGAGVFNWAKGNAEGLQISGLINRTAGHAQALQVAGLMNLTGRSAKAQVGGLVNVADDVGLVQVSGIMNISKGEMKGFQLALINISDSVSGVPIGLINIVKRGYNKLDIYASEILHGNLQLKLGAKTFYNIFHIGAQVPPGDGSYIWGLGYGIGTVTTVTEKDQLNWELMAIHISENEAWTNSLNSIGQFRFIWNHQLGKSIGFFIGPTFNAMVSQLRNPETGEIKSPVVPYSLINDDLGTDTNLRAWVGANAGFRF
ncbi:MAG TPA: hypothetical protein ENJ95_08790 [Bacteroidetes bacterium]|nr:hypothetical protein [Bacteroidota bacterium]